LQTLGHPATGAQGRRDGAARRDIAAGPVSGSLKP
jgi:hypothetical protein